MRPPVITFTLDAELRFQQSSFAYGTAPNNTGGSTGYISDAMPIYGGVSTLNFKGVVFPPSQPAFLVLQYSSLTPSSSSYISTTTIFSSSPAVAINANTKSILINASAGFYATLKVKHFSTTASKTVSPLYSSLKKDYKRDGDYHFLRQSLSGNLVFKGIDFDFIEFYSDLATFIVTAFKDGTQYAKGYFAYTDCNIDYTRKEVSTPLSASDEYSDLLDHIKDQVNLFDNPPAVTKLSSLKRGILQTYIQGTTSIMNFFAGSSYESSVDRVDDQDELINKYHFSLGGHYNEMTIVNSSYASRNGIYIGRAESHPTPTFVANDLKGWYKEGGGSYLGFHPVGRVGSQIGSYSYYPPIGYKYKTWQRVGDVYDASGECLYNTYLLTLFTSTGSRTLQSSFFIVVDQEDLEEFQTNPYLGDAPRTIPMQSISSSPVHECDVKTVMHYGVFSRLLLDLPEIPYGTLTQTTRRLTANDFAYTGRDYHYAIPVAIDDGVSSGYSDQFAIIQERATSTEATKWGADELGKYFVPFDSWDFNNGFSMAICPSMWVNSALWFTYTPEYWRSTGYDSTTRKRYEIPAFSLSNVIGSILKGIGSDISFSPTTDYSEFLYGTSGIGFFMTPITNVTAGEGAEPATKAEISLEEVLELLWQLYDCYWWIDDQNRLRIENIRYLLNGGSYSSHSGTIIDLSQIADSKNRTKMSYFQAEKSFDVEELYRAYNYGWEPEQSAPFGGYELTFFGARIPRDKIKDIKPSKFVPDLELMTIDENAFDKNTFAIAVIEPYGTNLVEPNKVSFINNDASYEVERIMYPLNYDLTWPYLFRFKLTYIDSLRNRLLPKITYPVFTLSDVKTKSCGRQTIRLQVDSDPSMFTRYNTPCGLGLINSMSIDINTRAAEIILDL